MFLALTRCVAGLMPEILFKYRSQSYTRLSAARVINEIKDRVKKQSPKSTEPAAIAKETLKEGFEEQEIKEVDIKELADALKDSGHSAKFAEDRNC